MKKTNKLFALLLSICMIVLIFPIGVLAQEVPVATGGNLATAIAGASPGDIIKLSGDVEVSAQLEITKNLTIDLDGHTISATSAVNNKTFMFNIAAGATVTFQNGKIKNDNGRGIRTVGTLNIKNIVSNTVTRGLAVHENGVATVDKDSSFTATATDDCPVYIFGGNASGDSNKSPVLNFYGKAIHTGAYIAISGNGFDLGSPTINLYEGAEATTQGGYTIFMSPYRGTLNVYGGTYTGATALVVRTGTINIEGGTFTGNGAYQDLSTITTTSGAMSDGSAVLIVSPSGYSETNFGSKTGKIELTISDKAVLQSENYRALNEAANADAKGVTAVEKIEVNGGTFTSKEGEATVAVSNVVKNKIAINNAEVKVTSGVFSELPIDFVASTAETIKVKSTYSSLYMIGTEATAALQNLKSGDTVEVLSNISTLTLPAGVIVENKTGSEITVNAVTLSAGQELTVQPTSTDPGNENPGEAKPGESTSPDTGDDMNVVVWVAVNVAAVAAIISVAVVAIKRKKA